MVLGWLLTALVVFAIGFASFALAKRQGWFDEPTLQRVEDPRILKNFRDDNVRSLDAAAHQGHLYVAQQKGRLQRYHPRARTWSSIDPTLPGLKNQDFAVLRSGNGGGSRDSSDSAANASDAAKVSAADRPLWAMTGAQGLAALHRGEWQTIAGDTPFLDGNGLPVQQASLRCAAISDDKRYALFGTDEQGVGIYDRVTKQWTQPTMLRHSRVSRAIFWKDLFWVAGQTGLHSIEVDWVAKAQTTNANATRVDGLSMEILDLDVSPAGALHILGRVPGGGATITSLASPNAEPVTLLHEGLVTPDLELRDIHLAFQPRDTLWLAGDAGLHSYTTDTHTWKRHATLPVSRGVASEDGTMFFGVPGVVVAVDDNDNVSKVKIPARNRIQDLSASPLGYALALTASNRLFEVTAENAEPFEWFPNRSTALGPDAAFAAVAHRSKVLFATERGIVLHDVVNRSYVDYPIKQVVPAEICDQDLRYHLSYPTLYITRDNGTSLNAWSISFANAVSGDYNSLRTLPQTKLSSPVQQMIPWRNNLLCISRDGTFVQFSPNTRAVIGRADQVPTIEMDELVDVAQVGNRFHLASDEEVHTYDLGSRTWQRSWRSGETIRELGPAFGGLAIIHDDQSVSVRAPGPNGGIVDSQMFNGNPRLADRDLVDVQSSNHILHVGTRDGRVLRYDNVRRKWLSSENVGKGPVDLVGSFADQALSVCDNSLFLGGKKIEPRDGPVHRAFEQGGAFWAIRGPKSARRLFVYTPSGPGTGAVSKRVYFQPGGAGFRLEDVESLAPLPQGMVVRTRNNELHEYNLTERRWRKLAVPKCTALFYQGAELFFVFENTSGEKRLHRETAKAPQANSRSTLNEVVDLTQVAGGDLYVLQEDGAVLRMRPGLGPSTILGGKAKGLSDGPETQEFDDILRVTSARDLDLIATREDRMWRYRNGFWTGLKHNYAKAERLQLSTSDDPFVTARFADKTFYAGRVGPRGTEGNTLVYRYSRPTLGKNATIVGAWQSDSRWTFLDDRSNFHRLNPATRKWDPVIIDAPTMPTTTPSTPTTPATPATPRDIGTLELAQVGSTWLFIGPEKGKAHIHVGGKERTFREISLDLSMPMVLLKDGRFWRIRQGRYEQSNTPDSAGYPRFAPAPRAASASFRVGDRGQLDVVEAGGRRVTTTLAAADFTVVGPGAKSTRLPALNGGWIAWNPAEQSFQLRTSGRGSSGQTTLTAEQITQAGHLLPEQVTDMLVHGPRRVSVLTPKGVFIHHDLNLSLLDQRITFQPIRLKSDRFKNGRLFDVEGQAYFFDGTRWAPEGEPEAFGGVVIDRSGEHVRLMGADGKPALGPDGLQRDTRLSLTTVDDTVWVNTSAGSHSLADSAVIRPRAPAATRPAAMDFENAFWRWNFQPAGLVVSLPTVPEVLRRGPPDFAFDEIIDAVEFEGRSYMLTSAGLERMTLAGSRQPEFFPINGGKALETFGLNITGDSPPSGTTKAVAIGADSLCVRSDKGLYQFDGRKFYPTTRPGFETLYYDNRLEFVRRANGQIDKYLRLDDVRKPNKVGQQTMRVLFRMSNGRFPFDNINDVHEVAGHVYLATDAGLEVHFNEGDYRSKGHAAMVLPLAGASRIWHLGGSGSSLHPVPGLSSVPGLARGEAQVRAVDAASIWQAAGTESVQPLNRRPMERDRNVRFRNGFWEWRRDKGKMVGEYRAKGSASLPVTFKAGPAGGRAVFEHDRIADAGMYDESSFVLWANGWVSMIPGGEVGLGHPDIVNEDWSGIHPKRFIRLVDPARPNGEIRRTLLLEGRRGDLHEYDPGRRSFVRVTNPDRIDLIRAEDKQKLVYQDKRLRLHPPARGKAPNFEVFASTGWTPLPWHPDGVLGIDRFDAVAATGEGCWAVTRSGLLHLDRPTAAESLRPFSGRLRPLPTLVKKSGEPGVITDLLIKDGHLYLRQDSQTNLIWRTTANAAAADSLVTRWNEDPFSERLWVDSDEWQWRQVGTHSGNRGWMTASWRGEDLQLIGGRFPFDTINSIAFFDQRMELGTEHGGWLQSEEGSIKLGDLLRPDVPGVDPASVRGVRIVPGPEGTVELGLVREKDVLRLSRDNVLRETTDAPALQFDDGFWTAVRRSNKDGGSLEIYSERGAPITRLMVDGRFDDQRVTGLPITTRDDDGTYTLLPTAGGLLRLGSDLQPERVVLPPDELPPRPILVLDRDAEPHLLSPTNAVPLDPERPSLAIPMLAGTPLYAEHAPLDLIRVFTMSEGIRQQTLMRIGAERPVADVEHLIPLSGSDQVASGGDETAVLGVSVRNNMVLFRFPDEERGLAFTYKPTRILRSVMTDRYLFLLSGSDLWAVDVERAKAQTLERRQEIGGPAGL